jgi:hypothetical protein
LNAINIVSFDIPFPANYGGVIDVFYKITSLHKAGFKIYLHAFQYGNRKPAIELEQYCEKVIYYKRSKFNLSFKPFIVSSRASKELLTNLKSNNFPILFEALHSCNFLNHPDLSARFKIVRMHNIEHDYYKLLAKGEESFFKKLYLSIEGVLLFRFEPILKHANSILAISLKDANELTSRFGDKVILVPPFHAQSQVSINPEMGDFAFYHGKLSVVENHVSAMFLLKDVMPHSSSRLVIAGDGAKESLKSLIAKSEQVELVEGLNPAEIDNLIRKAQVNLLPTFQPTGIKLKLVNCLFLGKHLLANLQMVEAAGLIESVTLAETGEEMAMKLDNLMQKPFEETENIKRKELVTKSFCNKENADLIATLLFKLEPEQTLHHT